MSAATSLGCYDSIPSSYTSKGSYTYQSSDYCSQQCSSYSFFALTKGSTCYCGNDAPSGDSSGDCSTTCFGYGAETCGGDSSYNVYAVADNYVASSANDGSSSTAATTSSSATSASSSPTTSSSKRTSATTDNDSATTTGDDTTTAEQASTTSAVSTKSNGETTMVIYSTVAVNPTATATATSTVSASSTPTSGGTDSGDSDSKKTSKGAIIGAAVGGVVGGIALIGIGVALFFWLRRRQAKEERDAELADSAYYGAMKRDKSQLSRPLSNPFLSAKEEDMIDQRLNPVMLGRRRISEGSLADEADYSRKILRVANPDDED